MRLLPRKFGFVRGVERKIIILKSQNPRSDLIKHRMKIKKKIWLEYV